ncbi:hypothetical protein D4R51_00485 [bacterium]|nr:MAG: hypothetical protein D4R51_00485 [bacterium]
MKVEKLNLEQHEKKLVSYEESLKLAKDLLTRYQEKIRENMDKDVDGWGEFYTSFQKSIGHFLEQIPEDILRHYDAHGITRNDTIDQLAACLSILSNKSIRGEVGILGVSGYESQGIGNPIKRFAFTKGDFLVVSKFDKPLPIQDEKEGSLKNNETGWEADIGAFVVDVHYYPLVDELKDRFPDVNIIKANELPLYFGMPSDEIAK